MVLERQRWCIAKNFSPFVPSRFVLNIFAKALSIDRVDCSSQAKRSMYSIGSPVFRVKEKFISVEFESKKYFQSYIENIGIGALFPSIERNLKQRDHSTDRTHNTQQLIEMISMESGMRKKIVT